MSLKESIEVAWLLVNFIPEKALSSGGHLLQQRINVNVIFAKTILLAAKCIPDRPPNLKRLKTHAQLKFMSTQISSICINEMLDSRTPENKSS